VKIADTNDTVVRLGEVMRAADRHLAERTESLVSGMGEFLARQKTDQ